METEQVAVSVPSRPHTRPAVASPAEAPAAALKIGDVSRLSGLPVKTIRFYSEEGLIHPSGRSEGGYRLYTDAVFAELTLIRTLKAMEIPLEDVRKILEARRSGLCTCASLQGRIRRKAGEIEEKIAALRDLQGELDRLLRGWEDCGGRKPDKD